MFSIRKFLWSVAVQQPVRFATLFCWINVPGVEAEKEPLTMSDLNKSHSGDWGRLSTLTLCAENMIQIEFIVSEI